jgi:hypothetical protein
MYGVFVIALGIVLLVKRWGRWGKWLAPVLHLALAALLTLLLFAPWGIRLFSARIPEAGEYLIQQGNQSEFHRGEYNAVGDISAHAPWPLIGLSIASLAWLIYRRETGAWIVALWAAGLVGLANPYLLGLPGTGIVNNFAVLIMSYIPIGVLCGALVGAAEHACRKQRWMRIALLAIVVLAAGWGTMQRARELRLEHAFVTPADVQAMDWIHANTPSRARFLVNGFLAYGEALVVGADAGWWIPLLAHRENTLPPLTYGMEATQQANYGEQLRSDYQYLSRTPLTSPEGVQFLREQGVTHLYVGKARGMVGNPGRALIDVDALEGHAAYHVLYQRDGVWILELLPEKGSG